MAEPAEQIILERLCMVPGSCVYWIGRKASRLTFLSQQQRALNLVWALQSTGKLSSASSVAIVGPGLAGITAASAVHRLKAEVVLFESKTVPLHLQRGAGQRFIHPYIFDWPAESSNVLLTDMPCMNWGAAMASHVSNTVLEEWRPIEQRLEPYYGWEVRSVQHGDEGRPLLLAEGRGRNIVRAFDLVLLAVGFGLERPLPNLPLLSYWENDNYGRPIVAGSSPRTYLVTGCGDGGLIDAIRLRINAFDHANFVHQLQLVDIGDIRTALLDIDKRVAHEISTQAVRDTNIGIGAEHSDESAGVLLEQEYRKLVIPDSLKNLLTGQLREDTIVYLNSPARTPYALKASILNRFLVFLLREYGGLRYRPGKLEITSRVASQGFNVTCKHSDYPAEQFDVAELVVRHEPISVVDKLFPKAIVEASKSGPKDLDDPTRHAMYPSDFLYAPDLLYRKRQVAFEYALSNAALVARTHFDANRHDRFGVEFQPGHDAEVRYVLRAKSENTAPSSQQARSLKQIRFYEFPVVVDEPDQKVLHRTGPTRIRESKRAQDIRIGDGIFVPDSTNAGFGSMGTIGCFVRVRNSGESALLTTGYALGGSARLGSAVYLKQHGNPLPNPIASVAHVVEQKPAAPGISVASGGIHFNSVDAGIAILSPHVKADFRLGVPQHRRVKLRIGPDASIGDRVFKVGATTGVTFGEVTQIAVIVGPIISEGGHAYWYRNLFVVEGLNGSAFSDHGDGGALVVRADGLALGVVCFGNGQQTYACKLDDALSSLQCELL
jgi:hypothetical protein